MAKTVPILAVLALVLVVGVSARGTGEDSVRGFDSSETSELSRRIVEIETQRSIERSSHAWRARPAQEVATGVWRVDSLSAVGVGMTTSFVLRYRVPADEFVGRTARPTAVLEVSDQTGRSEPFAIMLRPGERELVIHTDLWGLEAESLTVRAVDSEFTFLSIAPIEPARSADDPIPIEMSQLLSYPQEIWRREDFELFSWSLYPRVLWIDSRDYAIQAAMFRRLAFFVEKRDTLGTLLTDDELVDRHGWNAHNYRGEGLADFFNAVETQEFPINDHERTLREIVERHGIIARDDNGRWRAGPGGILGISQESYYELRRLLLIHEAFHGIFYEEPAFRDAVGAYWNGSLDEVERDYWRGFFAWMSYSPSDEYLMINEFQAYLLQQREAAAQWYFRVRVANRLRNARSVGPDAVNAFLQMYPETFVDAAAGINAAVFAIAGMVGGDPFCLYPLGTEG